MSSISKRDYLFSMILAIGLTSVLIFLLYKMFGLLGLIISSILLPIGFIAIVRSLCNDWKETKDIILFMVGRKKEFST